MRIDFSNESPENLEKYLNGRKETEVIIRDTSPVKDLFNATKALKEKANWVKNVEIINKDQEFERFRNHYEKGENFTPEFEFRNPEYQKRQMLKLLNKISDETRNIDASTLEKYGAQHITEKDFQKFFQEIFREFKLNVGLAEEIKNREMWKQYSSDIWPMLDDSYIQKAKKGLESGFEIGERDRDLESNDLKSMWQDELERVGIEWNIEIREVSGCFNIPEDKTVVIADGKNEKRFYSQEEAELLTMHELFHVARSYNGYKTGEISGLPPILGVHTPFYDMTEEGGAVYREKATDVDYPAKGKDYYLRTLAAYYTSKGLEFQEIVDKLIDLGGSMERSFYLTARNREILRHHIYLGGYWKHWKNRRNLEPLLLGKINTEWAEKLWKEVKASGMLSRPPVTSEDLFDYRFKN